MSSAVGLNSAIHPGARIFAPVVAGYLIDYLGVPMEGAGVALYMVAMGQLPLLHHGVPHPPRDIKRAQGANGFQDLKDGLKSVRNNRIFFLIIGTSMTSAFFAGSHIILVPVFADKPLRRGVGLGHRLHLRRWAASADFRRTARRLPRWHSQQGWCIGGQRPLLRRDGHRVCVAPWYSLLLAMEFLSAAANGDIHRGRAERPSLRGPQRVPGTCHGHLGHDVHPRAPMGSMQVGFLASAISAPLPCDQRASRAPSPPRRHSRPAGPPRLARSHNG